MHSVRHGHAAGREPCPPSVVECQGVRMATAPEETRAWSLYRLAWRGRHDASTALLRDVRGRVYLLVYPISSRLEPMDDLFMVDGE